MRRIATKYAKPEMVLGMPVYSSYGTVLLKKDTRLHLTHISTLLQMGVSELFIADNRLSDVPVWPLVTPEIEGALATALRSLMTQTQSMLASGTGKPIDLTKVHQLTLAMIEQLFPVAMGDPYINGCPSLNDYEYVHPIKVASLSLLIGKATGFEHDELVNLGMSALLQNFGHIMTPRWILDKPEKPTEDEFKSIKKHASYSAEILKRYGQADPQIVKAILQHHERWDGSGYPGGLKGDSIYPASRIIAIADTCYALSSKRPFRKAFSPREANEFIMAYSGELFDPNLVKVFTTQIPLYPTGVMVKLNTGEIGIISDSNRSIVGRPKVRICFRKDSRAVTKPYDVNLADTSHRDKLITEVLEF